jgi:hypothetical protein
MGRVPAPKHEAQRGKTNRTKQKVNKITQPSPSD